MSATAKPQGKTTYVASESDRTWPLNVQRALHAQSREVLNYPTSLALTSAESPVHNERCTPGSDGGARKPPGASRKRRRAPTIRERTHRQMCPSQGHKMYPNEEHTPYSVTPTNTGSGSSETPKR